ncbi:tRNA-modifying protein YgfZ [Vibrio cidicii]|nr:tRNA-modifying protein YgfZ [Vibrio cidicii]
MQWKNLFSRLELSSSEALPELAVSLLDNLSLVTITGNDKKSYLQGQVTCDVVSLQADQVVWGGHCDAKGKLWSTFRLFHFQDGYAMLQDQSAVEIELQELKKYAIFSKVEFQISEKVLLGISGIKATDCIDSLSGEAHGPLRVLEHANAVQLTDKQWLLIVEPEAVESVLAKFNAPLTTHSLWDLYDILQAAPRIPLSAQGEHIPQAVNLQAVGGISFKKGCYTGQETVARAKYRGINKRAMYIVSGDSPLALNAQQPITLERSVGENWRKAGELMHCYQFSDQQALGLMVLPNDLDPETELRLAEQPETRWRILPLPYSLADE